MGGTKRTPQALPIATDVAMKRSNAPLPQCDTKQGGREATEAKKSAAIMAQVQAQQKQCTKEQLESLDCAHARTDVEHVLTQCTHVQMARHLQFVPCHMIAGTCDTKMIWESQTDDSPIQNG